jgi:hypothetical protein
VSATIEGRRERGRTELKESKKKKKSRGEKREKERRGGSRAVYLLSSISSSFTIGSGRDLDSSF